MAVNDLQRYAVAFVVIGVVLAVGLSVMTGVRDELSTSTVVSNEADQPATPLPTHITVDEAGKSTFLTVIAGTETLTLHDVDPSTSTASNSTVSEADYTAFYSDGKFQVESLGSNYSTAEGDKVFVDYTAEYEDTDSRSGANNAIEGLNTFTEWLPLIALVVVAAIIIGLVSMFRGSGRGGSRGRA